MRGSRRGVVLSLTLLVGCAEEPSVRSSPPAGDAAPASASPGRAGCTGDAACPAGQRCLDSMVPGPERYCSPRCAVETAERDCDPLISATASLGDARTRGWSELRARGLYCLPADNFGAATPERRCGFLCPRGSAAVWDRNGRVQACACLPGHAAKSRPGGALECVVNVPAGRASN